MIDIVFLTLPRLELRAPITAPAILKSVVENHGFSAFCFDINIDLWHKLDEKIHGNVWLETDLTFRYEEKFNSYWDQYILPHTASWISVIKEKNPTWIGITVFSQRNKWMTVAMCKLIRKELPNIKIVIGGPFTIYLGNPLLEHNLIDVYVNGEGEHAIVDVLSDNYATTPGVNGNPPVQINNLNDLPVPDYSDYDMKKYSTAWYDPTNKSKLGTNFAYITGSRGCVRRCSFCDIGSMWPKFRYRSGDHIAEEIQNQAKHGIMHFLFTDSLLNGNSQQLIELCTSIINQKNIGTIPQEVSLEGQFAVRSEYNMPEEIYALMSEAGMNFVSLGIESGSESVRKHMQKQFTDTDLEYTLTMCAKYNIKMCWLLMVGYPTETEEDFQKTLDLLKTYKWINEMGLVSSVALGPTLDIVEGSRLYNDQKKLGIAWDNNDHWIYKDNDREIRIRRWLRLKEVCMSCNYVVVEKATNHLIEELKQIEKKKQ